MWRVNGARRHTLTSPQPGWRWKTWVRWVLTTAWPVVFWFFFTYSVVPFSLQRKYTQRWEDTKDQIHFKQTDTPVYRTNKNARIAASEVSAHGCRQWYLGIFIVLSHLEDTRASWPMSQSGVWVNSMSPLWRRDHIVLYPHRHCMTERSAFVSI